MKRQLITSTFMVFLIIMAFIPYVFGAMPSASVEESNDSEVPGFPMESMALAVAGAAAYMLLERKPKKKLFD